MSLKILYAASNNIGSKIQLDRFIRETRDKPYEIKIAAYRKSSPLINVDWTLDCLQNMFKPEHVSLDNENFLLYFDQVKRFAPDLVISDLEYFTSYIALDLNIALWQCSSSLINFALTHKQKYNLGLFKRYYYLFHKVPLNIQRIINMIDNSNFNFVYSHLGDTVDPPHLLSNFEWIRPYHQKGKSSALHQHNIVAASTDNNKKILGLLQKYPDSVSFSEFCAEEYPNVLIKELSNYEEYTHNLSNCNLFICEGSTSFLADAFYNGKYSVVLPNVDDTECIINSVYSENLGLSKTVYSSEEDISLCLEKSVETRYNEEVRLLHQKIMEY